MHQSDTEMVCSLVIPEAPSRNANSHDDVDDHLGKKNEEEGEEVEGAVTPRQERKTLLLSKINQQLTSIYSMLY